jgi:hypothetical protein
MRRSTQYLLFTSLILTVFLLLPLHAQRTHQRDDAEMREWTTQLRNLQLTDLCLSTEARYTRHPALSDRHAPFQEHPAALEHFPSGSIILPFRPARVNP